jgi:MoaA/NifB/PqqE/SkfB family radical SAM enzyme
LTNISKLLAADKISFPGDALRYGEGGTFSAPVVVWHMTSRCNLACRHCYAAHPGTEPFDMDRGEASAFLGALGRLRVPALLMSGGEPMAHPEFFSCVSMARDRGLRVTLSTNGTMIDRDAARRMSGAVGYVGVSVDGPTAVNDAFRGMDGAFRASTEAMGFLAASGVRVGLRVTLARPVLRRLPDIFRLAEDLPVSRICFYHFVPSGRGALDASLAPSEAERARAVGAIIEWADSAPRGASLEILTVGDASDGVRVREYLRETDEGRLAGAEALFGRAASGVSPGLLSVRWDGVVFPNQFAWDRPLGTWRELERIMGDARRGGTAPECLTCAWSARGICPGRLEILSERLGEPCPLHERGHGRA